MRDVDQLLDEQQRFYSAKSEEYVDWIRNYMDPVRPHIEKLVHASPLSGSIVELAPGTGYWTETLSDLAHDVTAVDGSREMLDIVARRKLPNVTLVQADLFAWQPDRKWDYVFFVHWLAHVPIEKLPGFWKTLDQALKPGGQVIFVDVTAEEQAIEEDVGVESSVPVVTRSLDDGQKFTVVKTYWDPDELISLLSSWGWTATATPVARNEGRGFVYYTVERTRDH
ncbi:class I SAM-dependent methyltransferase [Amycolatopsis sp. K13G38]|uniref:Class I SAM-dependent methyltransferase n=1 Tax=Amycolatopsis acididurans TaxID=2724524 RepID=A0ABX1JEJ2_9PSEU|nr:class I SAM-dependent methyltransferase [Amycolatopsis acididurans]NKQ58213.1 class I SAM-dependent methyltransferase [Amycolatopsis acididurans]